MIQRVKKTLKLVERFIPVTARIYDMGNKSELSSLMGETYRVINNSGDVDFDFLQEEIKTLSLPDFEGEELITTSFEVFEHLLNPFTVLRSIQSKHLLCTVPLKVWFSPAYWGKDERDRHFHEFEQRQFLWLLDKTGWKVIEKGKWRVQRGIGIRPILRLFWPSYLWVYCERKELQDE